MITIQLNDKKLKTAIKKLKREINNPNQLFNMVGKREIEKAEKRLMTTKISPNNAQWTPWAYTTAITRRRDGTAARGLLYQTGHLLNSFYYVVKRRSVEIRNRAFYARYLQFGTSEMPSRKFMGWGADSMKSLPKAAKKFFGRVWK